MTTIALVEDDVEIAEWICCYLEARQYHVVRFDNGLTALETLKRTPADVVILDGMLPGLDGFEVCKQLRLHSSVPILMLTARDEEIDEIVGLEMGADDYLTKPVRGRLLETRIRTLLRRSQLQHTATPVTLLELGCLSVNKTTRAVQLRDEHIHLSSNEFDALWLLATRAGQVVTRDELTKVLRGFDYDGFDRSVDLRVSRLRKKLRDNASEPYKIKTIWGKGYLLSTEVW